jgi:DNA-binding response OmpR family regulator
MRLLLVEDDAEVQRFLVCALTEAGYQVNAVGDASCAAECAIDGSYDILVVDLGLPDRDGLELISSLRGHGLSAPVLILTGRRSVNERIRGLSQGGDDYLTKPFALGELLARIRNLLRRNAAASQPPTTIRVRDLELDLIQHEVSRSGKPLQLTSQEYVLLEFLCRNSGHLVTRSMILERVWGIRFNPKTNVREVHMSRLRGKLDDPGGMPLIETVRGKGYIVRNS